MNYIKSLKYELKNVTWINKKDLLKTVFTVGIITVFWTAYIYGIDSVADMISRFIIETM